MAEELVLGNRITPSEWTRIRERMSVTVNVRRMNIHVKCSNNPRVQKKWDKRYGTMGFSCSSVKQVREMRKWAIRKSKGLIETTLISSTRPSHRVPFLIAKRRAQEKKGE